MSDKDLYHLVDIKTPPISVEARTEIGYLLREVQAGKKLSMPQSRPMPDIGRGCHELRIKEENLYWRDVYYVDNKEVIVLEVFAKKTEKTPLSIINISKARLRSALNAIRRIDHEKSRGRNIS